MQMFWHLIIVSLNVMKKLFYFLLIIDLLIYLTNDQIKYLLTFVPIMNLEYLLFI